MIHEKITFLILSSSSSPIKRATFSKSFLRFMGLFFVGVLIFLSTIIYDYLSLKKVHRNTNELKSTIANQRDEIVNHRQQIQNFANEINGLKTKLVSLNDFESKIRIIANIEKNIDQEGLFGVGGSIPVDLDASVPLKKKHNSLVREMHGQMEQMEFASSNQREGFESLLKNLEAQRNLLACTPAIYPTRGWTTSHSLRTTASPRPHPQRSTWTSGG